MSGLFAGTPLERPVTCDVCERPVAECECPRNAAGRVVPAAAQTAVVRLEKRRKGKVVTTVAGLDPVASDLDAIVKQLKTTCGTGGTVQDDVIEVQGDHRDKVTELVRALGFKVRG